MLQQHVLITSKTSRSWSSKLKSYLKPRNRALQKDKALSAVNVSGLRMRVLKMFHISRLKWPQREEEQGGPAKTEE